MKASNTIVMVQAYRLLVDQMQQKLKYNYPLHLGVTEAGVPNEKIYANHNNKQK